MGYADYVRVPQVTTPDRFFLFAQQQAGIGVGGKYGTNMAKKALKDFFEKYPNGSYNSLCKLVHWAKTNNVRYELVANLVNNGVEYAIRDGFLDELKPERER